MSAEDWPPLPRLTLVLGGSGSGKSAFAETLAAQSRRPVLYVATATASDSEMAERIAAHRLRRPPSWRTVEVQRDVPRQVKEERRSDELVLLEDLSLLVANLLPAEPEGAESSSHAGLQAVIDSDLEELCALPGPIILVGNELGMGLVPLHRLGRLFVDAVGRANQFVAARAERVYLVAAGLPLMLKDIG